MSQHRTLDSQASVHGNLVPDEADAYRRPSEQGYSGAGRNVVPATVVGVYEEIPASTPPTSPIGRVGPCRRKRATSLRCAEITVTMIRYGNPPHGRFSPARAHNALSCPQRATRSGGAS